MLVLSIPLHVGVFVVLYFGGLRLVQRESLAAHASHAPLLLRAAVTDFHLALRRDGGMEQLGRFADAHREIGLRLWNVRGELLAGAEPESPADATAVAELLAGDAEERFWLDRDGGIAVRGLVRLRADASCAPCHEVGELRGVAAMHRDLGATLGALERRLLLYVGLGAIVWLGLAVAINRSVFRAYQRSARHLRAELGSRGPGAVDDGAPNATMLALDPMSLAVYESLAGLLREQGEREERFAARLHHADRLASLGQLAAGLAHEIKNPLAGVQGALELLRDDATNGGAGEREIYEQMLGELRRVDGIIRSLLRFARPAPPRRAATDVAALLEDAVGLLRPGLVRRGVALEIETAPGLEPFPLDAEQIRQVLVNLITNAADAITGDPERQGGRIAVRATALPEEDGLLLAVADDGPGIPAAEHGRVFEPFVTTKFDGTGLGLAVADRMVTDHGGRLEVASEPGDTTFFILLPRAAAETPEDAAGDASSRSTESPPWPRS